MVGLAAELIAGMVPVALVDTMEVMVVLALVRGAMKVLAQVKATALNSEGKTIRAAAVAVVLTVEQAVLAVVLPAEQVAVLTLTGMQLAAMAAEAAEAALIMTASCTTVAPDIAG